MTKLVHVKLFGKLELSNPDFENSFDWRFVDPKLPQKDMSIRDLEFIDHETLQLTETELKQWLEALRDPKAKQTRDYLCRVNPKGKIEGECCLGVYARIMNYPFNVTKSLNYTNEHVRNYHFDDKATNTQLLSSTTTRKKIPERIQRFLSQLNDTGWTFSEIATVIEALAA